MEGPDVLFEARPRWRFEMRRILFIAGREHSGTTLLEMLLSGHSRVCGLGETRMWLDPRTRSEYLERVDVAICSCGSVVAECDFWGEFLRRLGGPLAEADFVEAYGALMEWFGDRIGPEVVLCDSSKNRASLAALHDAIEDGRLPDTRLDVVHLIKDVRSYLSSMKRAHGTRGIGVYRGFGEWYQGNRTMQRLLEERRIAHVQASYEKLCFETIPTLTGLCDELELEYEAGMEEPGHSSSHVGLGNPMRFQEDRNRRVEYDHRWLTESDVHLVHLLRPVIRRFNDRVVYQRGGDRAS